MRTFLLSASVLLIASGCVTPQIPLPPPVLGSMSIELDQQTKLVRLKADAGGVPSRAFVKIAVREPGSRVFWISFRADDNGSFESPPFPASDNTTLEVDYERLDGENGESLCIDVDFSVPEKNLRACK